VLAPPGSESLAVAAREHRLGVLQLPAAVAGGELGPLRCPAVTTFTSGSTGVPKAVCRPAAGIFEAAEAIAGACGLRTGDGVLATLPHGGLHGVINGVAMASVLDSEATLVERFDHRTVLAEFATGRHAFWQCSPHMADMLARCSLPGPAPRAPRVCKVGGSLLAPETARRFAERFRTQLRNAYGSVEHGVLCQEVGDGAADSTSVGRPLAGVRVLVGDRPEDPLASGERGPVWAHAPWQSLGLGFPPALTPHPGRRGDWIPTSDVGWMDEGGRLHLLGRSDDLFKTPSGHLVSPTAIEEALASHPEVGAVAVVPLPGAAGARVGAVVEGIGVTAHELRRHAGGRLPEWACPQVIEVVVELPRLPAGKVDRRACLEMLEVRDRDGRMA
jgi:acyl-CoA synthetase (AMP-forming)/AMP-acid ligase II